MPVAQQLRRLIGPLELIHDQAGPRLLRLTRMGVCGLWLIKLLLDPLWRLAQLPPELIQTTGILGAFPEGLSRWIFTEEGLLSLWIAAVLMLLVCLTNRFFWLAATLTAILLTIYSAVIRSFGPAVHTDIVLLLAVYVLALFSWADLSAGRSTNQRAKQSWSSFPVVTIVMILCLSYSLVGMNRVMLGGWRVFTGDSMEVWTIDASLRGYYFNTNVGWHVPHWPLVLMMLRSGLPVITLFELTAPLCLIFAHYRWVFIPVMLSFHLLSLVFMNIFFFDDMLLYLLLVDWSRRLPSLRSGPS